MTNDAVRNKKDYDDDAMIVDSSTSTSTATSKNGNHNIMNKVDEKEPPAAATTSSTKDMISILDNDPNPSHSTSTSTEQNKDNHTPTTTTTTTTKFTTPGEGWTNNALPQQMLPFHNTQTNQIEFYSSQRRLIHTNTGWTRVGDADPNDAFGKAQSSTKKSYTNPDEEKRTIKSLMSQLCESFYNKGWQVGTGGGVSMRIGNGSMENPYRIFTTPSGIQKEDMISQDIFELDMNQMVVTKPTNGLLKLSSMTSLWYVVYRLRPSTMCVLHTHSMYAQLVTMLDPTETMSTLRVTHLEMIKGVGNHGYEDMCEIPIIDNQSSEDKLGPDLAMAIMAYPKANAVLVRRHGVYVWGDSWEQAKTQLECFDYLFETAVKMKSLGLDCGVVPHHSNTLKEKEKKKNAMMMNNSNNGSVVAATPGIPAITAKPTSLHSNQPAVGNNIFPSTQQQTVQFVTPTSIAYQSNNTYTTKPSILATTTSNSKVIFGKGGPIASTNSSGRKYNLIPSSTSALSSLSSSLSSSSTTFIPAANTTTYKPIKYALKTATKMTTTTTTAKLNVLQQKVVKQHPPQKLVTNTAAPQKASTSTQAQAQAPKSREVQVQPPRKPVTRSTTAKETATTATKTDNELPKSKKSAITTTMPKTATTVSGAIEIALARKEAAAKKSNNSNNTPNQLSSPSTAATATVANTTQTTRNQDDTNTKKRKADDSQQPQPSSKRQKQQTTSTSSATATTTTAKTITSITTPKKATTTSSAVTIRPTTSYQIPILPISAKVVIMTLSGCIVPSNFFRDFIYPSVLTHVDDYIDQLQEGELSNMVKNLNVDTSIYTTMNNGSNTNNKDNKKDDDDDNAEHELQIKTKRMVMKAYVKAMVKYNIQSIEFQEVAYKIISWTGAPAAAAAAQTDKLASNQVYQDVMPFLTFCHSNGVKVYIFANESFYIQGLVCSKIRSKVRNHYDQSIIGSTKQISSYTKLKTRLSLDKDPKDWHDVVFLSENVEELEAATGSGIGYPVLCRRSVGVNQPLEKSIYPIVKGLGLMALTKV